MKKKSLKYKIYRALLSQRFIRISVLIVSIPLFFFIAWYGSSVIQTRSQTREIASRIRQDIESRFTFMEGLVRSIPDLSIPLTAQRKRDFFMRNEVENGRRELTAELYIVDADGEIIYGKEEEPAFLRYGEDWGILYELKKSHAPRVTEVKHYHVKRQGDIQLQLAIPVMDGTTYRGAVVSVITKDRFTAIAKKFRTQFLVADAHDKVFFESFYWMSNALSVLPHRIEPGGGSALRLEHEFLIVQREEAVPGLLNVYSISGLNLSLLIFLILYLSLGLLLIPLHKVMKRRARKVANDITDRLDEINMAFEAVEHGDMDTRLSIQTDDEFATIASSYNHMLDSIEHLLDVTKRQAEAMRTAQIRQLESQFNPHFLFNTLEIIRVLIRMDPAGAQEVLRNLSDILRYSIRGEETVRLQDDLDYVMKYLAISKKRFSDRLEYHPDIDEDIGDAVIPKLLFQPLIENAIKHGMNRVEKLVIGLVIRRRENTIHICITDNGGGMSADDLSALQADLAKPGLRRESIGVRNIAKRIELLFGEAGTMTVSNEAAGLCIKIVLPYRGG
ncbi:MAG: histidine kinase [Eubacteriales bacterium]|nr:histidine kinase [Eubacteriales bacterium]